MRNEKRRSRNLAEWLVIVIWIIGLASVAIAWGQAKWYAFHPHYLPLCTLYVALVASTLVVLGHCLRGISRGPRRVRWLMIAFVAILPAGFWAFVGFIAQSNFKNRQIPNTLPMRAAKVMGATLMRAECEFRYQHQMETDRLVMFYNELEFPEQDLAEMDRHLARLEDLLGGKITGKVHWIRGQLLGQSYVSFHGLSLGSDYRPERVRGSRGFRGDRHELAHAALDWFRLPESDPPYVLHEGWAMAQCGDDPGSLARDAADARLENPSVGIRALFGPDWYYRATGEVYSIGGAFVDFLIRSRGAMRFRKFYTECKPSTVDAQCREILGTDLDSLETEFWQDVDKTIQNSQAELSELPD